MQCGSTSNLSVSEAQQQRLTANAAEDGGQDDHGGQVAPP